MQLQHQVPGKVPEGTGSSNANAEVKEVGRVVAECVGEVPGGSGAVLGSGSRQCLVRFRKVPMQKVPVKVPR